MAKTTYIIKTTSGYERVYTLDEMLDTTKQYLQQKGKIYPTREECMAEIPEFIRRFKLVD